LQAAERIITCAKRRDRTKQAQLIARLERAKGATVAEIADPIISGEASVEIVGETGHGP